MRGTRYPMITMMMDVRNMTAKSLCERVDMSLTAFHNKMRGQVQNSKERAFTLPEAYGILDALHISRSEIFKYFPG